MAESRKNVATKASYEFKMSNITENDASFKYDNFTPEAILLSLTYSNHQYDGHLDDNPNLRLTFKDRDSLDNFFKLLMALKDRAYPQPLNYGNRMSISLTLPKYNSRFRGDMQKRGNELFIFLYSEVCTNIILPFIHKHYPFNDSAVEELTSCKINVTANKSNLTASINKLPTQSMFAYKEDNHQKSIDHGYSSKRENSL